MAKTFYSNGKLLLTGEYAVLDGALSLAVPTKYGQSLSVKEIDAYQLQWKSDDENGEVWFEGTFDLSSNNNSSNTQSSFWPGHNPITVRLDDRTHYKSKKEEETSETLLKFLREAHKLNPDFLKDGQGYKLTTKLDFPRDWGLGSSSTLINNIAQWANVDVYQLLWNAFSGSGYDVACAQHNRPILYRRENERKHTQQADGRLWPIAKVEEVDFNPPFQDQLYFIHLNEKQNSREGIAIYRKKNIDKIRLIKHISEITRKTIFCKNLSEFESLMVEHEMLLSKILQIPTVKKSLFPDFTGIVKSLGAWGGDFVLATGNDKLPAYFERKGYKTVIPYTKMVLEPAI